MEIKSLGFEVKAAADFVIEGYAAVFRNVDSYGDIIEPGAFSKTIQENKRVKVLWQHDPWQPIGKPISMAEDNHGLFIKAQIAQTERGKEAFELIKEGVIDEMSIGYQAIKHEYDKERNARLLKEIKLWEFSPVTFAANEQARITDAKNFNNFGALAMVIEEMKQGKVLSEKNATLVKSAIEALTALLDASEGKNEPPKSTQLNEDEKKAAGDILAMISEMRKFASKI